MQLPSNQDLGTYVMREAVFTAIDEAKATPIEIGKQVGHTDFATHGTKSGKLQGYEGDEAIVKNAAGDEWKWKTEGMVDVERVYVLAEIYAQKIESLMALVEFGEALGIPADQTITKVLGPGKEDCNCEYCTARKAALAEAQAAEGTPQVEAAEATTGGAPAEEVAATAEGTSTGGGRFPFNEFLNTVGNDN
jgi:hypothetical protein